MPWLYSTRAVVRLGPPEDRRFFPSAATVAKWPKHHRCCMEWRPSPRGWHPRPTPDCAPGDHDHIGLAASVLPINTKKPWRQALDGCITLNIALEADGNIARTLQDAPENSVWIVDGVELLKTWHGKTRRILRATALTPTTEAHVRGQLAAGWIERARASK